jgi:hypothetical protein
MKPTPAPIRRVLPGSPFNVPEVSEPAERYAVNDRVQHDKYGLGRVTDVEDETFVVVSFATRQVRIATPDAKLTKL